MKMEFYGSYTFSVPVSCIKLFLTEALHFFAARITARHSATMKKFAANYYVNQPFLPLVTFAALLLT